MGDINAIDDLDQLDLSKPEGVKKLLSDPRAVASMASAKATADSINNQLKTAKALDLQRWAATDGAKQIDIVGEADSVITAETNARTMQADAEKLSAKQALIGDYSEAGSKANYWAGVMHDSAAKASAAMDVVHEKSQYTLLNNPLGYIGARFTLPAEEETVKYYQDKKNLAEGQLNDLTKLTTDAANEIDKTKLSMSIEQATAEQNKILAVTAANKDKMVSDYAGKYISGIGALNTMSHEQAALAYQELNAQNADRAYELQVRAANDQHAIRLLQTAARQDMLDNKEAQEEEWKAQLTMRNIGADVMHLPRIDSLQMFKREYAMRGKDPEYNNMLSVGQIAQTKGTNTGVMKGQNAGDIARAMARDDATVSGDVVATYLSGVYAHTKGLDMGVTKDKVAFDDKVNTIAVAGAKSSLARIDGKNDNIYDAPPVSRLLATDMVKGKNAGFINTVLAPMVEKNPELKLPPEQVLAQAKSFKNPDGSEPSVKETASAIAAYYTAAKSVNNKERQYVEYGLPPQLKFNAVVNGRVIDLSDEVAVTRYLLIDEAKRKAMNFTMMHIR